MNGIAITDHDHLMEEGTAEYLSEKYNFPLLPGVEISAEGIYAHILAFGISREIRPGLGIKETVAKIKEQGGVSIVAHPFRYVEVLDPMEWKNLDCVETLNPNCSQRQNMKAREIALNWKLPQIGSSDVHRQSMVGTYATLFEESIANVSQLKKALLMGKQKPLVL